MKIKTGDILLVHSKNKFISKGIQWFEKIEDKESGYWNHSAIFVWCNKKLYLIEADYLKKGNKKSKIIAALKFTNFEKYKNADKYELKWLESKNKIDEKKAIDFILKYESTLYDYGNFFSQIYRTLVSGYYAKILGKKKHWKRKSNKEGSEYFICHEWTMFFHNHFFNNFPDWSVDAVEDIYYSNDFIHHDLKII